MWLRVVRQGILSWATAGYDNELALVSHGIPWLEPDPLAGLGDHTGVTSGLT